MAMTKQELQLKVPRLEKKVEELLQKVECAYKLADKYKEEAAAANKKIDNLESNLHFKNEQITAANEKANSYRSDFLALQKQNNILAEKLSRLEESYKSVDGHRKELSLRLDKCKDMFIATIKAI